MSVDHVCARCGGTYATSGLTRHLQSCYGTGDALHVVIEGADVAGYWLHLALAPTATLRDLDTTLRETWLECCGHMSRFEIDGAEYWSTRDDSGWGRPVHGMTGRASKVMAKGTKFAYEYDFGSSTNLKGRVVGTLAKPGRDKVTILERNDAPVFHCAVCQANAERVCGVCGFFTCEGCRDEPCECEEDYSLAVVNSPRMGVCAYEG